MRRMRFTQRRKNEHGYRSGTGDSHTPGIQERLSQARLMEWDILAISEISPELYSDARNEIHRMKAAWKTAQGDNRDRLEMDIDNIRQFIIEITEARLDKIIGLASSEAITRDKMDRSGMTEWELIMMNKITDAILVGLREAYKISGVTE